MLEDKYIIEALTEELGRTPTQVEIETERNSRIDCLEAMYEERETLNWNGDY